MGVKENKSGFFPPALVDSLIGAAVGGDETVAFAEKMNNGETTFEEIEEIENVEKMLQMTLIDYNFDSPLDNDSSAMTTAFAEGKAAMYHNGSWSTGDVLNLNPDINIGFFGYPISEDPEDQVITYDAEIAIPITKNAADFDACAAVLDYFADSETGAKQIAAQSRVPVAEVEMDEKIVSHAYTNAMDYVEAGKTTPWINWLAPTGFNDDIAGDLQNYAIGEITFDELLELADQKWANYAGM